MNSKYKYGQIICECRTEKGLSQVELAELCDMEASRISRYETCGQKPRVDTLEIILGAMGYEIGVVKKCTH